MGNLYSLSQKATLSLYQGLSLPRVYQQKGQWKGPITSLTESSRVVQITFPTGQANSAGFVWIRSGKVHTPLSTLWIASGGEQLGTAVAQLNLRTGCLSRAFISILICSPVLQLFPEARWCRRALRARGASNPTLYSDLWIDYLKPQAYRSNIWIPSVLRAISLGPASQPQLLEICKTVLCCRFSAGIAAATSLVLLKLTIFPETEARCTHSFPFLLFPTLSLAVGHPPRNCLPFLSSCIPQL